MYLEMYLGGTRIERVPINFAYLPTVDDREIFLSKVAAALTKKHRYKIQCAKMEPVFFIDHVGSKMNLTTYAAPLNDL